MTTYFLSYARADAGIALRFADDLIAAGLSVWVDQYEIRPSQHWDHAVESAVRGCDGMIVILSPRSAASHNVADEVSVAIDTGRAIIPILVESCTVPLRMTRMQFIDATEDYDGALRLCLKAANAPAGREETGRPPASARSAALSADVLQEAERRLVGVMGPIARTLVSAAAGRARTRADLYRELAKSIPDAGERKAFLGWSAPPDQPQTAAAPQVSPPAAQAAAAVPDEDLHLIAKALSRHLGPIAPHVVSREHGMGGSRQDLCRRLGARIASEKERAAFLKAVGST